MEEKVFLVFNTACFGDVLVCNSLCQNIKSEYPESKIVFICDKSFADVAKYQKDVDEVIIYDKKGANKGIKGLVKFIKGFPYKKPFASFVTYPNMRNVTISYLLGIKNIYEGKKPHENISMQYHITRLLAKLTNGTVLNFPIKYVMDSKLPEDLRPFFNAEKKYVAFAPISKNPEKDMPLSVAVDVVNKLSKDYVVVYTGAGEKAFDFAKQLKDAGADFLDLTNKTSFPDLARVLQNCSAILSVDTGTMHLSYALEVPVACVFYRKNTIKNWAPDPKIYNNVCIIDDDYTAEHMYNVIKDLVKVKV